MESDAAEGQLAAVRRLLESIGTVRLGPVLSSSDVGAFERRHGILLPDGFRRFVLEVGNGGDGPGYGLAAFDPSLEQARVAHPFPLERVWVWEEEENPDPARVAACRDGWLPLGTEGCGMDWILVVSGNQRGHVWNIEGQGAQPCAPALEFLAWYRAWLQWTASGGAGSGIEWWDVVWADYSEAAGRRTRR